MRKMKDSGIEWIGEIPEDWECFYLSQIFTPIKNKNIGLLENNLLSLSYGRIVRKNIETSFGLLPENFEGYNIIQENDIVLRLTDLQNDHKSLRVGIAKEKGIITSAYLTLRSQINKIAKYFYYLLHSFDIVKGFYGMGAGVRQGLNWNEVCSLRIIVPPFSEQQQIADYLDKKVSEIDSTISKTRESIEEYKKLKQAIITEAVTKGLNPNAKMKNSGIEWIGEIPEEWKKIKFKYLHYGMNTGEAIDKEYWSSNEYDRVFYTAGLLPIRTTYLEFPEWKLTRDNDLLLSRNGTPYVYLPSEYACYTDHIIRAKIKKDVCKKFLQYALQRSISTIVVNQVSIATWSASLWNEQILPFPPLSEQQQIADYLDQKCSEIDKLITKKEQLVVELESYKKSLIYEVVTGKRGV